MDRLESFRGSYAQLIAATAGLTAESSARIIEAYATVPRERFIGPPPWKIVTARG